MRPAELMAEAVALATENVRSGRGGPFAAIVTRNGTIIARGTNRVTSTNDPTAHAEVVAIREACRALSSFHLTGCEIYSTCEPCPMCMGAIYWARPDKIYYASTRDDAAAAGFSDRYIYEQIGLPPNCRSIPMAQVSREDALPVFDLWAKRADKIRY